MFKNQITICVSAKYWEDVATAIFDMKFYGGLDLYEEDGKVYATINTRMSSNRVRKEIERKLYKTKTDIHGNIIFVEIES